VEQGKSGKVGADRRPLFEQMKRDAALRKFDRLLVWKVPRLGRDMRQVISTVYELADLGVTVVPIKSQTGPINSTLGKLLWAIQAWYGEMENDERSQTIRAGQARARATGNHLGAGRGPSFSGIGILNSARRACRGSRSPISSTWASARSRRAYKAQTEQARLGADPGLNDKARGVPKLCHNCFMTGGRRSRSTLSLLRRAEASNDLAIERSDQLRRSNFPVCS